MSSPFPGPPTIHSTPRTAASRRRGPPDDELDAELAKLPGRANIITTASAGAKPTTTCCTHRRACTRSSAYYHYRAPTEREQAASAKSRTAEEMAKVPTYYVIERDKGIAETVTPS